MKKILLFIVALFVFIAWEFGYKESAVSAELIAPNEIYVFTQKTCSHCQSAEKYLKDRYPDLKVHMKDIAEPKNRMMFFACAAKFKLNKYTVGTPLFCMGDHYVLGWSFEEQQQFDTYVQDFLPKN